MKIKKLQFIVAYFLTSFLSFNSTAQYEATRGINQQLRKLFSQLTFPDTSIKILYERSAKFIDDGYYKFYNPDSTIYEETWMQMYRETYYAAHDTNDFLPIDSVLQRFDTQNAYTCKPVKMAVINYNMYNIKKEALDSGDYFVFDTVNDMLFDHPSPIASPYFESSFFVASPMINTSFYKDVTYTVAANNIFADNKTRMDMMENYTLQINFGDGLGFRSIDQTRDTSLRIIYPRKNTYPITTQLVHNISLDVVYLSKSTMEILSDNFCLIPDRSFGVPGMTVGVYNACTDPSLPTKKIIIV
ncbi:MAG: hypothetical protein ABF242_03385 [Flavobacteriales bacterium]